MKLILLRDLGLQLPLNNPVLIFSVILFIVLFAPLLLNKLRIPQLIGLIIAGAVIGPNGFNLLLRDSSVVLFGTVGLLYIMFLAGLEIDLADFKKNRNKSMVFGMYTFLIPMGLGIAAGHYLLGFAVSTSVLLASMFASHTLIAYPLVSKIGIAKSRSVNVTVGGTLITDTLALLVLAVIAGMATGEIDNGFWLRLGVSVVVFALIVTLLFPLLGRWFFKKFDDNVSQYIFVLALVFLAAFLAEAAGIEAIIGAFLAGLALNRLIPHTSPLMNRIEFVGNALFIPFFLIGVGMLIDYRVLIQGPETLYVAAVMTGVATTAKFLAAWATQKTFQFTSDERLMIFGLSNAQAAATLAAVLVGYNIVVGTDAAGNPIRLLSESVLNGTVVMILVTCAIASFAAQRAAERIALTEKAGEVEEELGQEAEERILIPISYPESIDELINLGVTIKSKASKNALYPLHVIPTTSTDPKAEKDGQKLLEQAAIAAAATDNLVQPVLRYFFNLITGILNVAKELKTTDMILGLHKQKSISDSFLGSLTEGLLSGGSFTTLITRSVQPLNTIRRYLVLVPPQAELEEGFSFWLLRVWNIGRNTGASLIFYATPATIQALQEVQQQHPVTAEFVEFMDWEDFLIISRDMKPNDSLIVVLSRPSFPSYTRAMDRISRYLNKYFTQNSVILIYPLQTVSNGEEKHPAAGVEAESDPISRLNLRGAIGRLFGHK